MNIKKCFALLMSLNPLLCYALDPVSWKLSPATNPVHVEAGGHATAVYILTNNLPKSVVISTEVTSSGAPLSYDDQCNKKTLAAGTSCNVYLSFNPTTAKKSTFQLIYQYDHNRIPLPVWTATSTSAVAKLSGVFSEPTPFPSSFATNQSPFVAAQFTNNGTVPLTHCVAGTALNQDELTITPASAATVTTDVPTAGTCGTTATPITLNPGDPPCTIYGQLSNLQDTASATLIAKMTCDQTAASTSKTVAIQNQAGACTSATITPVFPLPTSTYLYADNMVTFRITNTCTTDNISLGTVDISATTGNATITGTNAQPPATYDNCSGQTLTPGQSCTIMASVIPNPPINAGGLTVTASVSTGGVSPATGSTSATTVRSNNHPTHHILFVNQCPFDVWYGVANGNGSACPGTACQSPDPNLAANPTGAPASAYHLAAQTVNVAPATIDLSASSYQNGAFWPRTGCTMQNGQFNCATGTCQTMPNSATCLSPSGGGTGPVQPQSPFTKFEATLVSTPGGDGVYDVSIINGMTVPVEVKAFGPSTGNTASTVYNCSGAGSLLQPATNSALGNCSWNFDPGSTIPIQSINSDFYWVTPGADNGCANSINCGMSYSQYPQTNGNSPGPINRRQGNFLGFNPLVNDAGYTSVSNWGTKNLFHHYGMDIQIPGIPPSMDNDYGTELVNGTNIILPNNTYAAYNVLLSIPGVTDNGSLNSCYQVANSYFEHCGGCIDWLITLPSTACGAGSSNYQSGWNADWLTNPISAPVGNYTPYQAIQWLKQGCPTAYSYQFDDPSSSFQCNADNGTQLLTSYQVTFCPGGVTGLPAGATEGRSTPP